jgi:hypothetical protein
MFVNKRLKGFENRGFWWHPQVGTPTEPRRPYQTKTSVNHVTLKGPIRKPPTPQFLPLPQQAQTIFLPNVLKATAAVPSMEPPPSPLMGETPPATSESSPALPMEEPPPTLSMESPLVEGLEESQRFFSEYEDIEEDSQLEVDESGDSDISSDDDEYCDLQILYHGS